MTVKKTLFILVFLCTNFLLAQEGKITFNFIDKENNQPIDSVQIKTLTNNKLYKGSSTTTLTLPIGIYSFEFYAPSYEPSTLYETEVKNNQTIKVDIFLSKLINNP